MPLDVEYGSFELAVSQVGEFFWRAPTSRRIRLGQVSLCQVYGEPSYCH